MKALLDKYLQSNYKEVQKYASYFISRSKLNLNPQTIISNSYLRYVKIDPELKHEYEAKGYFFHIIKTEILWRDTESKKELVTCLDERQVKDEIDDEILIKFEEELKYQNQKGAVEIYRNNQIDRVKLIFFETFYDKQFNTVRSIADHFGISVFAAHGLITEMKNDIREILQKHETI
jgi:predicted nucleic acid-binding protein